MVTILQSDNILTYEKSYIPTSFPSQTLETGEGKILMAIESVLNSNSE